MPDAVSAIYRAVVFIEQHLDDEVNMADLAAAADYSLFHFSRLFNRIVRHTPYDYLMRRRLSQAALALLQTDDRIIDIALRYQFHSPEVFARAFRRMFACQPSEFRTQGQMDPRRLLPAYTRTHLEMLIHPSFLPPLRISLPEVRVEGLMACLSDDDAARASLWQIYATQTASDTLAGTSSPDAASSRLFGIVLYLAQWPAVGRFYLTGSQLAPGQATSPPLVEMCLPAGDYAAFRPVPGFPVNFLRDYIFGTWLPRAGFNPAVTFELELFTPAAGCLPVLDQILIPLRV